MKGRMQRVGGTMGMKGIVQVEIRHIGVVSLITKETAVQSTAFRFTFQQAIQRQNIVTGGWEGHAGFGIKYPKPSEHFPSVTLLDVLG